MDNLPKEKGENIKCYVRCRPLNEHEKGEKSNNYLFKFLLEF